MAKQYDVAVIGAGAAGMMCAGVAGQRGKTVVLLDHSAKLAEKIRISGGGRCNFTNINTSPQNFLSENPHFCKSALSRYTPQDFLTLIKRYRIGFHEKHKGQLFCDNSAEDIIHMLKAECDVGNVTWRVPCKVLQLGQTNIANENIFRIETNNGTIHARKLVIATGGPSIPAIGATDFAYHVAKQFDIPVVNPHPALVPLRFDSNTWQSFAALSGLALEVDIKIGTETALAQASNSGNKKSQRQQNQQIQFREDLLFTHRGLSGPAVLQISSFWEMGKALEIDLLPEMDVAQALIQGKGQLKKNLGNLLAQWLPSRLAENWLLNNGYSLQANARIADMPDKQLQALGQSLNQWRIMPNGSEGYRKAEVTRGGIDTKALSQQTMMSNKIPGLYFVGEAVDVTGWLGGYNFQWAWASGMAAGLSI